MDYKKNSLVLFRYIAAIQVMYGHIIEHLCIDMPYWLSASLGVFLGVPIFFTLSGYLIWFSIENTDSYKAFIKKRFIRIYPELWCAVILNLIAVVILYDGYKIKDLVLFTFTQSTVFQFWTPDSLRGYGVGTPNGSLWTICVLIQFYIISWWMYYILKKQKLWGNIVTFVCVVVIGELINIFIDRYVSVEVIGKLYSQTVIRYLWMFMFGMILAKYYKVIIPFLKKFCWGFLILAVVSKYAHLDVTVGYGLIFTCSIICFVIGFSYLFNKIQFTDVSYSIYLYHMIVVNIFVTFGLTQKKIYLLAVMLISLILAYISTKLIGNNSKKLFDKKVFLRKDCN